MIECSSLTANLACVKAGLGAGCVPDFAAREAGLVRLTDPVFAMMGAVVMHPDMERSPRVRAVADFLVDYLRSQPAPFT